MKSLLILGTFLVLAIQAFGYVPPSDECPTGCNTNGQKCCTTAGGSTYYGHL